MFFCTIGTKLDQTIGIVPIGVVNVPGKKRTGSPPPSILLIYINTGANGFGNSGVHQKR